MYFVRDNNVYGISLDGGPLRQVTDIRRGPEPAGAARDTTGQRAFLRAQQRRLFEFVRRPPRADPDPFAIRGDSDTTGPRPFYLAEGQNIQSWDVSPDGRYLLLTVSDRAAGARCRHCPSG
ncbi:MAG: hypothetical protein Q8Q85_03275 [Gemmatimonadales bacterium]|nr:hypothetical protein [Gemmatimonadales bacterium]